MSTRAPADESAERQPGALADPAIHQKILQIMERMGRGRALDIPTGQGAIARSLLGMGFTVEASDIDPARNLAAEIPVAQADLNKPLPFDSERFDYVVSIAGLQRLYHPDHAISEFHRILKPGGWLLVGLPNYANLRRRLRFLYTASITQRIDRPTFNQTIANPAANFRQLLLLPRVWSAIESAGFVMDRIEPAGRVKFRPSYLFWLPFAWLSSQFGSGNSRRATRCGASGSPRSLMSTFYAIIARKPVAGGQLPAASGRLSVASCPAPALATGNRQLVTSPAPIADIEGHDLVVEWMKPLPRGRVLDLPTGRGGLARRLAELGFQVECGDIDRGLFETPELPWRRCNLNEPLPLSDASFDYVACVAGLQRVYHPEAVLVEFRRILKPGGQLMLGLWNFCSLRRRIRFLKTGSISGQLDAPTFDQTIGEPEANFRNLLLYHRVVHGLADAGFDVRRVRGVGGSRFRPSWGVFWMPLVKMATLLGGRKLEERTSGRTTARRDLLLGSFHVYQAIRKP